MGRYDMFVKTVLVYFVRRFYQRSLLCWVFPSRSYCLAFVWEIDAEMEIEEVCHWECRFTLATLYGGIEDCRLTFAMIYDGIWDVPFYLALCDSYPGSVVSSTE